MKKFVTMLAIVCLLGGATWAHAIGTGEKILTIYGPGAGPLDFCDTDAQTENSARCVSSQQAMKAYVDTTDTTRGTTTSTLLDTKIHVDTVEISNAELITLRASAKSLVAAPGAAYYLEFISAVLILDYGSAACTESADNLVIEYITSGADLTAAIETTGFIDQTVDQMAFINAAGIATDAASDIANNGIQLFNTGDGEFGTCTGSTMTVHIAYRVHATGL